MPAKKLVSKKNTKIDEDDTQGKEKKLESYEDVVVRTIPDRTMDFLENSSIPSIQHGKSYNLTDNNIPKSYKIKHTNPVSTQKSAEAKNIKLEKVTSETSYSVLLNNLKATLQNGNN